MYKKRGNLLLAISSFLKDLYVLNERDLNKLISEFDRDIKNNQSFKKASNFFITTLLKTIQAKKPSNSINSQSKDTYEKHRKERCRERGFDKEYKILLNAWRLLNETDEVIKKSKAKISQNKLFQLIKISNYLLQTNKSIDSFLDSKSYPEPVKELIAHSLGTLLDVEMNFRGKWYSDYWPKGKSVVKCPDSGVYHRQIAQDYEGRHIKWRGKSITAAKIYDHAWDFIEYLIEHNYLDCREDSDFRDGDFYRGKGFRALLMVIGDLQSILYSDLDDTTKKELDKLTIKETLNTSKFSVDAFIEQIFRQAGDNNIAVGRLRGFFSDWRVRSSATSAKTNSRKKL